MVAFSGHAYVLADVDPGELAALGADGYGGASGPDDVPRAIAGADLEIGSLDVVLSRPAGPASDSSSAATSTTTHVRSGPHHRRDVEVYGDDVGVVILGRGLVDRRELSVECSTGLRRPW